MIKGINYVSGWIMRKEFIVMHTFMNKVTGCLLFFLPLTISFLAIRYSAFIVCFVATLAAIQEGHWIRVGKSIV